MYVQCRYLMNNTHHVVLEKNNLQISQNILEIPTHYQWILCSIESMANSTYKHPKIKIVLQWIHPLKVDLLVRAYADTLNHVKWLEYLLWRSYDHQRSWERYRYNLNPETQDSTVCASQISTIRTIFQVKSTIEEVLSKLTETVCVSYLTRRKPRRFIYGTQRQRDHWMCHGMELI